MNKKILASVRSRLPPKSYWVTKPGLKKRRTSTTQQESPVNAFSVFVNILRELRALTPTDRDRVMDAIRAELGQPRPPEPATDDHSHSMAVNNTQSPETEVIPHADPQGVVGGDLLNVPEAAKVAGVSRVAFYSAIARGKVKADKSSGKVKVARAEALAYRAQSRPRKK